MWKCKFISALHRFSIVMHDYTFAPRAILIGNLRLCSLPFWNMCHPETCFRFAWCAVRKKCAFLKHVSDFTVQTLTYRSRMINAWSWSIKISEKRPKVRSGCISLFVCSFFSNKSRATSNVMVKKTYCRLPSIWQSLHGANLKHILEMHIFQNGTPCCNLKHVSGWHMFQNASTWKSKTKK